MGAWWKPFLIAGLIGLSQAMPAAAGILEDRKICDGNGAAEPQIHACGRLIASGRFKGRDLGVTYNNRAFAYLMTEGFHAARCSTTTWRSSLRRPSRTHGSDAAGPGPGAASGNAPWATSTARSS